MEEWIGEIRFSQAVEDKLQMKHDLTAAQVRAAVACGAHEWARSPLWTKAHPRRLGRRWAHGGVPPPYRQAGRAVGMSDGMEDELMDDEIRDALKMTKEELLARAAKGEPADVARSAPSRRDATAPESGAITMESDVSSIVIEQGHFEDHRVVKVERPSVTVRR